MAVELVTHSALEGIGRTKAGMVSGLLPPYLLIPRTLRKLP